MSKRGKRSSTEEFCKQKQSSYRCTIMENIGAKYA